MKLFYQLTQEEQDNSINHCADLIVDNSVDKGLQIEPTDDEDGRALKRELDSAFSQLQEQDFKTKEEKASFLMGNQSFSNTVFDLAAEMAQNAYYHEENELVIYLEQISSPGEDEEVPEKPEPDDDSKMAAKRNLLN